MTRISTDNEKKYNLFVFLIRAYPRYPRSKSFFLTARESHHFRVFRVFRG
jgi:hypothetical protein